LLTYPEADLTCYA